MYNFTTLDLNWAVVVFEEKGFKFHIMVMLCANYLYENNSLLVGNKINAKKCNWFYVRQPASININCLIYFDRWILTLPNWENLPCLPSISPPYTLFLTLLSPKTSFSKSMDAFHKQKSKLFLSYNLIRGFLGEPTILVLHCGARADCDHP